MTESESVALPLGDGPMLSTNGIIHTFHTNVNNFSKYFLFFALWYDFLDRDRDGYSGGRRFVFVCGCRFDCDGYGCSFSRWRVSINGDGSVCSHMQPTLTRGSDGIGHGCAAVDRCGDDSGFTRSQCIIRGNGNFGFF